MLRNKLIFCLSLIFMVLLSNTILAQGVEFEEGKFEEIKKKIE